MAKKEYQTWFGFRKGKYSHHTIQDINMEEWDLVKIYCRAIREEHNIEAISIGYQLLEFLLITLMTKSKVGNNGIPLDYDNFSNQEKRFLYNKVILANETGFIDDNLKDKILEFNSKRADIIHNIVERNITKEQISECAKTISPIYLEIQNLFLPITFTQA